VKANCIILEGSWWRAHEPPLILPYFQALASSHHGFNLSHRTIRSADDIDYWIKKVPKGSRSFVYFACHGENLELQPVGRRSHVTRERLLNALSNAKDGAIAFLHFGCCEMIDAAHRRQNLQSLADSSRAYWVSGYTTSVDWLTSTLLDLALAAELYLAFADAGLKRGPKLQANAKRFIANYEHLARRLGFSGLSYLYGGNRLFPARLRNG